EGKQASLAADFSVTQFKHLGRLLMVHGRNSYKRSAALSQFVIHRSLCISTMQLAYLQTGKCLGASHGKVGWTMTQRMQAVVPFEVNTPNSIPMSQSKLSPRSGGTNHESLHRGLWGFREVFLHMPQINNDHRSSCNLSVWSWMLGWHNSWQLSTGIIHPPGLIERLESVSVD
ncbi:hypothetical protein GOODEAATRI_007288, partial [Goodea atripinnis]